MAQIKYLTIGCIVIGVAMALKFLVLPRLLRALLGVKRSAGKPLDWQDRVELRYQDQHNYVWMFAWFKLRLDPMFGELPEILGAVPAFHTALDLGCGFGIAGSSVLEWNSQLKIYGVDPDPKRVRAASIAFGERGEVYQAAAPNFESPRLPSRLDAVFILDVIHFLSDSELDLTLSRVRARLDDGGSLIIRTLIPPNGFGSILWNLDKIHHRLNGVHASYRSVEQIRRAIARAGFTISQSKISGANVEMRWFMAVTSSPEETSKTARAEQPDENDNDHKTGMAHNQPEGVVLTEFVPPL